MTTTTEMLQEGAGGAPSPRRRWVAIVAVLSAVALILAGLFGFLYVGAQGYYVITPGDAPIVTASPQCKPSGGGSLSLPGGRSCVALVIPADRRHTTNGTIMMVDVYEGKPTPVQYLLYRLHLLKHFDSSAQFLPNSALIGSGSASQLNCQDTEDAIQATSAAPVAALRRLGYNVPEHDRGAQVYEVARGTPAAAAGLECDDLITAMDGKAVSTADGLTSDIHDAKPGAAVVLTIQRSEGNERTRTLHITAHLTGTPARGGQAADPSRAFLGVEINTLTTYTYPFPVSAEVGSIGGPSDGLALALGFIDSLSGGQLTGGLAIAATGEIDPQGDVITIGGAAQKAVAVHKAGAKVFLVPPANYAAAKSTAGSMKVLAVSSLNQALSELEALGGQVPPAHAQAATMAASPGG